MKKFSIQKKGYSIEEVDDYLISQELENENILKEKQSRIDELRKENFDLSKKLQEYELKEKSISSALTIATDKANEIVDVSKHKYSLELKNLDDFYKRWETFFSELIKRYPKMEDFDTEKVLIDIKKDIKSLLNDEYLIEAYELNYEKPEKTQKDDYDSLVKTVKEPKKTTRKRVNIKINKTPDKSKIIDSENEIELMGEKNKVNNIKPISSLTLDNDEKDEYESLVDKFLHTNNNISKGYEKSILNENKPKPSKISLKPNESGFDLNEALNPTDDLLNIMKGFKLD